MESYSNLRCDATMRATLEPGEDPVEATKQLQSQCEVLVENHKQEMLTQIRDLTDRVRKNQSRIALKQSIEQAQERLAALGPEETQGLLFRQGATSDISDKETE